MATLTELLAALRQHLGDRLDPENDSWEADDTGYKWANAELVAYLNAARDEVAAARPIIDQDSALTTVEVGTDGWATLDARILAVSRVSYQGLMLFMGDAEALDGDADPAWETRSEAKPVVAYLLQASPMRLRLVPKPSATIEVRLVVHRRCLEVLDWAMPNQEVEEIPRDASEQRALIWWAAYLANSEQREGVADPAAAKLNYERFEMLIGPRPNARGRAFNAWATGRRPRTRVHL